MSHTSDLASALDNLLTEEQLSAPIPALDGRTARQLLAEPWWPARPAVHVGQSVIAGWYGVSGPAVSNWIVRHAATIPMPDVVVAGADGGEVLGWLPERRAEWDEWNRKRIENNPKGPRSRFVTSEDRENWR